MNFLILDSGKNFNITCDNGQAILIPKSLVQGLRYRALALVEHDRSWEQLKMHELLRQGWCQLGQAQDSDGGVCNWDYPVAVRWSLMGALMKVYPPARGVMMLRTMHLIVESWNDRASVGDQLQVRPKDILRLSMNMGYLEQVSMLEGLNV